MPAGVVLLDVSASFFMVVVPPKDHLLLLVELDEGNSADMEVIVFAVPQPFPRLADALLQQL